AELVKCQEKVKPSPYAKERFSPSPTCGRGAFVNELEFQLRRVSAPLRHRLPDTQVDRRQ
ncbi:MAG: hypothetical protein P8Z00_20155, partial [Anaerolineales bacterium]